MGPIHAMGGNPGGQEGDGKIRDCSSLLATPGAPTTLRTQVVVGCFFFSSEKIGTPALCRLYT